MTARTQLGAVFVGGFAGTVARAGLSEGLTHGAASWPWATFLVNLAGAALLGFVVARAPRLRRLVGTGFCSALTTFSTLQLELLQMLDGRHLALAAGYAAASLAGGLAAVSAGLAAGR